MWTDVFHMWYPDASESFSPAMSVMLDNIKPRYKHSEVKDAKCAKGERVCLLSEATVMWVVVVFIVVVLLIYCIMM